MPKKRIAKRVKTGARTGEKNKGVGCLTPVGQRKHLVRENRERAFALEYLRTMNARAAGKAIKLSGRTIASGAWQWLRRPGVQKIIQEEFDKRTDAAGVTEERIIRELEALAFSMVTDIVAFDNRDVVLVPSASLTRLQSAAIQSVQSRPTREGTPIVSIKMHDKLKALELLMRCKGMISTDGKSPVGAADARDFAEKIRMAGSEMDAATCPSEPEVHNDS